MSIIKYKDLFKNYPIPNLGVEFGIKTTPERISSELIDKTLSLHTADLHQLLGRIIIELNNRPDKKLDVEVVGTLIEVTD